MVDLLVACYLVAGIIKSVSTSSCLFIASTVDKASDAGRLLTPSFTATGGSSAAYQRHSDTKTLGNGGRVSVGGHSLLCHGGLPEEM